MLWSYFGLILLALISKAAAFECPAGTNVTLTGTQFPPAGISSSYNGTVLCNWIIPRFNGSYAEVTINQLPTSGFSTFRFDDYRGTSINYDPKTWMGFVSPSEIYIQFQSGLFNPVPGNLSFSWVYKKIPYATNPNRVNLKTGTKGTLIPVYGKNTTTIFTYDWKIDFQAAFNPDVSQFYMMYSWYFIGEGIDGWCLGSMYGVSATNFNNVADGWLDNRTSVFTLVTMVSDPTTDYGVILVKPFMDMVNANNQKIQYPPKFSTQFSNSLSLTSNPIVQTFYSGVQSDGMYMSSPYVAPGGSLLWYPGDYYQNATPKTIYASGNTDGFTPQKIFGQLNTFVAMNGDFRYTISPTYPNSSSKLSATVISLLTSIFLLSVKLI